MALSSYLPSSLLRYFEEPVPHPYDTYEYRVLFGYILWAYHYSMYYVYDETELIPHPSKDLDREALEVPIPPFIKGANVSGIDSERYIYASTYDYWYADTGGRKVQISNLVPQMVAYLVSYDTKFRWNPTLIKLFWGRNCGNYILAAARAAASIGNFPLTCEILDQKLICDSVQSNEKVGFVLLAAIDEGFFDKLRARYILLDLGSLPNVNTFADMVRAMGDRERIGWFTKTLKCRRRSWDDLLRK